jgi:hypothetical protein
MILVLVTVELGRVLVKKARKLVVAAKERAVLVSLERH